MRDNSSEKGPDTSVVAVTNFIIGAWQEVLKKSDIDANSEFSLLGGDSLKATFIASRIRDHYKVFVTVNLFDDADTVAAQAARVLQLLQMADSSNASTIVEF